MRPISPRVISLFCVARSTATLRCATISSREKIVAKAIPMNLSRWRTASTRAAGAMVSGSLNDFYAGVARLPEGWLNIVPQPPFGTGLNYESQTRAGILNRDARYDRALPEFMYYPGSGRLRSDARRHCLYRVTAPVKIGDAVSVVPRAGYRAYLVLGLRIRQQRRCSSQCRSRC